jgi:Flp pilus assembly protein TadD
VQANANLGFSFYMTHRYDEAIRQLPRVSELDPDYGYSRMFLGAAYERRGDLPAAIEEVKKSNALMGDISWSLGELGQRLLSSTP